MTLPLPSSPHWPPTRMMTMFLRGLSCGLFGSRLGTPRLQVVEAGVVTPELELDGAGRSVSVLRHVNLGDARLLVGFIVLWPIKKHYNVTILFYAARLAKIAQYRTLVWALLGCATQLRDGDYRKPQLTCQAFQC